MPNQEKSVPTLQGQEAIDLWLSGKHSWNEWVDKNEVANVDFSGVDFGKLRAEHNLEVISFLDYRFPKGDVIFTMAEFGDGNVVFSRAKFGDGDVVFAHAEFGKGKVLFIDANFGKGQLLFFGAKFGDGYVSFYGAQVGEGYFSFHNSEFGEGEIVFSAIKKESGYFSFQPKRLKQCTRLDMSNSTIESVLNISGINSPVVLNLSHSKLAYPIDIDNIDIDYRWACHYFCFRRAIEATDSTSFRRLKKLALEAGDNERALDFYAKEMRTSYWHYVTGPKLALYYLYDWISDYGRSIWRPLFGLALIITIFAVIYMSFATNKAASFYDGLVYSAGSAIPFYSGSRLAHSVGTSKLFGKEITSLPDWIPAIAIGEGIISGIFVFLIILALRNTFRS